MPSTLLSHAEALFLHALQPIADLATLAVWWVSSGVVLASVAMAVGVIGFAEASGERKTKARRTSQSPTYFGTMTRILILLVALVAAAPTSAQTHAEAMQRLAAYAGTYTLDGTANSINGPSDDGGTYDGTLVVTPVVGGHFQQWDWEMHMRGVDGQTGTVLLRFITTYDPASQTYDIWRFDSREIADWAGEGGNDPRGTLRFDGDALVMTWPTRNPEDPSIRGVFRNTIRLASRGMNVVTDVQPDGGRPRIPISETRVTRR